MDQLQIKAENQQNMYKSHKRHVDGDVMSCWSVLLLGVWHKLRSIQEKIISTNTKAEQKICSKWVRKNEKDFSLNFLS